MRTSDLFRWTLVSPVVFLLFLAGCSSGPKTVKLTGTVVLPPGLTLGKDDGGQITFVPETEGLPAAAAVFKADNLSFTPNTAEKNGIVPGKYKIAVSIEIYPGTKGSEQRRQWLDAQYNKNFDQNNTKLTYEVTNEPEQSITIDLGKGTVTKG